MCRAKTPITQKEKLRRITQINTECKPKRLKTFRSFDFTKVVPSEKDFQELIIGDYLTYQRPTTRIRHVKRYVKAAIRLKHFKYIKPTRNLLTTVVEILSMTKCSVNQTFLKKELLGLVEEERQERDERDTVFRNHWQDIIQYLPSSDDDSINFAIAFKSVFHTKVHEIVWQVSDKSFQSKVIRELLKLGMNICKAIEIHKEHKYWELLHRAETYILYPLHMNHEATAIQIMLFENMTEDMKLERKNAIHNAFNRLGITERIYLRCKIYGDYVSLRTCKELEEVVAIVILTAGYFQGSGKWEIDKWSLGAHFKMELVKRVLDGYFCTGGFDWVTVSRRIVKSDSFRMGAIFII
ncbi:hypothetical protein HDU76_003175 [Blyttiomyces sp. JEL0837]|nr:hypothetical protein HDU76_003175 [Blyttiomyces sp. JEL0837]